MHFQQISPLQRHHPGEVDDSSSGESAPVELQESLLDMPAAQGTLVATDVPDGAEEWVEYWDESAGASYFYNTITQVISPVSRFRRQQVNRFTGVQT